MLGICNATGEIDRVTAPTFNAALHDAIDMSNDQWVVVDFSDVTFMDSAGFHVLVDATGYATRRGRTLVLHNLSAACAKLIAICDWDHELCVEL